MPNPQKGFTVVYLLVFLLVTVVLGGGYYFWVNNYRSALPNISSEKAPELKGFPVYPNSTLVTTSNSQECDQFQQNDGYSVCESIIYTWTVNDDFDKVSKWFADSTEKAGWHCNGGAGQYTSSRDASIFGNLCTKKGILGSFDLTLDSNSKNTRINLSTPLKLEFPNNLEPTYDQTGFTKRQFGVKAKFFSTQEFPKEILNIKENELVATKCTPYYQENDNSYSYYDKVTKKEEFVFDYNLLQLVKKINKDLSGEKITAFQYCETKQNTNLLNYSVLKNVEDSVSYFVLVMPNGSFKNIASIPNKDRDPYFGCFKFLQWSVTDTIYYQCGGGDGPVGASEIYSINIMTGDTKEIIRCTSEGTTDPADTKIECK